MLRQILLLSAVVVLLWASYLAFGFSGDGDLTEDTFGWGFLGLSLGFAAFFEPARYHR